MSKPEDVPYPDLTIDTYDARAQQHQFEMDRQAAADKAELVKQQEITKRDTYVARQRTKQERAVFYMGSVIAICVAAAVISLIYFIYKAHQGPDKPDMESVREDHCIEAGGGWVPKDLLGTSDHGMCVFPGKRAEDPTQ